MPVIYARVICACLIIMVTASLMPVTPVLASTTDGLKKGKAPGGYRPEPPTTRANCKCPHGFERVDQSCVKREFVGKPEPFCPSGTLAHGKCRTRVAESFRCPEGYESMCDFKSSSNAKCCRLTETREVDYRCPEGTSETTEGDCKRLTRFPPSYECPLGYRYEDGYCVRTEPGYVAPVCGEHSQLTPENTCLKTAPGEIVYECPEGFQCVSSTKKSGFCKTCQKKEMASVSCECEAGAIEDDGLCYQLEVYKECFDKAQKKKSTSAYSGENEEQVVGDGKKDKKCEAKKPECTCKAGFHLECKGKQCQCVREEFTAVVRRCLGFDDGSGNCVRQIETAPIYQCGEGQECESIDKKNECKCVFKSRKHSTVDCGEGVLIGNDCFSVGHTPQTQHCPDGFDIVCRASECQCERNLFTHRTMTCTKHSAAKLDECATFSDPEFACKEGQLVDQKCVRLSYTVELCDA
ncbi:oocyst wall protein OWP2 [Besnoitia besnoiti]|uniref:Oocyst wall protein OWP2 n=1 Tax=Besnoitia besnoiti TaxID=94643 RepID=A0A2A9M874_BESBE|nr:oocyst wall protein OWP2 [Besnoitia besnoiti]PFH31883.1 oocyst wall protein OWP2 [Besnoitia besnoiti]